MFGKIAIHIPGRRTGAALMTLMSLLALISFNMPGTANAAGEATNLQINDMSVVVLPEYDDPRLLVLYQGEFAGDQKFPQKVRFLVPKGAQIGMACAVQDDGKHLCQKFDKTDVGDYTAIEYELPLKKFALEYYADNITGEVNKSVDFNFSATYPVKSLEIDVQQPLKATDFKTDPAPASTVSDSGFNYSLFNYTNVETEKPVEIGLTYTKEDPNPSVEKQQPAAGGQGTTGGTTGSPGPSTGGTDSAQPASAPSESGFNLTYMLAGIAVMAAVVGGAFYWINNKQAVAAAPAPSTASRKKSARTAQSREESASKTSRQKKATAAPAGYCRNCGKPIAPDGKFCSSCGTETRQD